MKKLSIFLVVFLLVSSCNMSSPDNDRNLSVIIDSLKNENDSLRAELTYVAQLNQNIYQEREAVKKELNTLKKKYNIGSSSSGDPLAKYNLKLTRSKTGYIFEL